jgi:hypothetical protein
VVQRRGGLFRTADPCESSLLHNILIIRASINFCWDLLIVRSTGDSESFWESVISIFERVFVRGEKVR